MHTLGIAFSVSVPIIVTHAFPFTFYVAEIASFTAMILILRYLTIKNKMVTLLFPLFKSFITGKKSYELILMNRNGNSQRRIKNLKGENMRKAIIVLGVMLLSAIGFMFLGIFIDIQIILKYDYTPISFTLTFLFVGALIGFLSAFRFVRHKNRAK
jgi:hypothetical protein